ncbi:MAG: response regulator [Elusimicrobiales bacterium]|nr:response regulator [Elusimicrobiales bacterium]
MTGRRPKPEVLVINDDQDGRQLLVRVLAPHYKMVEAATGAEGLEKSLAKPDLILLDVNLPDIDGFEVCRRIKENALTAHIPVLHLSATSLDPASQTAGLENGADGFLRLPVETPVLVATINSLLRIKEAEAALAAGNAKLAAFSRIDRIFISTRGAETWRALLAAALGLFSSDTGSLGYLNEDEEMILGAVIVDGGGDRRVNEAPMTIPAGAWKDQPWAGAISGGAVLTDNNPSSRELPPAHAGLKRFLSIPLRDGDRLLGHITVANKPQDYTAEEGVFAGIMGGHISALMKGRLDAERQESRNCRMLIEIADMRKTESLSHLAGGIVHDFNSIMTGIIGNLSVLMARDSFRGGDREVLSDMFAASEGAQKIALQLLTFAKGGQPVKKPFDLGESLSLWGGFSLRGSNSRAEVTIAPGLWAVNGDEGQLSQVVNNLLRNSREAMPHGGVVEIRAENVGRDEAAGCGLAEGNYVRLTVADAGVGIQADDLERIFDPYFTTKARGHGLGLSMAYSIVKSHGGDIRARSLPGSGTEFTLYLPAAEGMAPAWRPAAAGLPRGSGRVLVMDDEEIVLKAASRMLVSLGYECVCAADGAEAIKLYRAAMGGPDAFHVVIADLTVPCGMGGAEAVSRLRELDPKVKVVLSSGYFEDELSAENKSGGFSAALEKPYRCEDLAAVLSKLACQT